MDSWAVWGKSKAVGRLIGHRIIKRGFVTPAEHRRVPPFGR